MVVDNAIVVIENILPSGSGKTRLQQRSTAPKKLQVDISRNPSKLLPYFAPPVLVQGEAAQFVGRYGNHNYSRCGILMFGSTLVPMLPVTSSTRQRHSRCPRRTTAIATGRKRSRGHRQLFGSWVCQERFCWQR